MTQKLILIQQHFDKNKLWKGIAASRYLLIVKSPFCEETMIKPQPQIETFF